MAEPTIASLLHGRRADTIQIGPVVLHMNPQSVTIQSGFLFVDVQTRDGYGRFEYGVKPNVYVLSGQTGNAGVDGKGGLGDMEILRPQAGRPNKLWPFRFPYRFRGVRYVKVNSFQDSMDTAAHLYNSYELELEEYPPHLLNPAIKVGGNPIAIPLPVGG